MQTEHSAATRDFEALDKLISPDYMAVNFEGKVSSKENEIATAKSDLDWQSMTVDEIHTRIWGPLPLPPVSSLLKARNPTGVS